MKKKLIPVIVTTEHRGVFFGYTDNTRGPEVQLKDARLVIYWTSDLRGFMGLAAFGPSSGCKIGPKCDILVRKVTSVVSVTKEAEEKWNKFQ